MYQPEKGIVGLRYGFRIRRGSEAEHMRFLNHGPIAIVCKAGHYYFNLYKSGVVRKHWYTKQHPVNHAIILMGYGETDDGVKYWLAKNSWGEDWGDGGFMRFERSGEEGNDGMFGSLYFSYMPWI